jgi:hypothetical protein
MAGAYTVTLKCKREAFPESYCAHLAVAFKP